MNILRIIIIFFKYKTMTSETESKIKEVKKLLENYQGDFFAKKIFKEAQDKVECLRKKRD